MSGSTKLFDTHGQLLPPEEYSIEPLNTLTKYRAKSPSRRSPSRNGRQSTGNETKLPDFVQEVTHNTDSGNIRIASPTARKVEGLNGENLSIPSNTSAKDGQHFIKKESNTTTANNSKASVLSKFKTTGKMEAGIVNEGALILELMEKPVLTWTTDDVSTWLNAIGLSKFQKQFVAHKVSGRTLLSLTYETLEKLDLSESSEEREHFLSEVYHLQQESGYMDDEEEQMMDKEIEDTFRNTSPQENNNEQTHIHLPSVSEPTPTNSLASSSRTGSVNSPSPTKEVVDNNQQIKQEGPKANSTQNKPKQPGQVSPTKTKAKKESSKTTVKKTKPRVKRISRLFNSIHGTSHKDPSLLQTAPPIYKNAFHNLMNTGPQGVIKVWTEMFLTDMQYVSLLVKHENTAFEVVKMVLEKSNAKEDPESYRICEINERNDEYILDRNECPLQRERQWSDPDNCRFELRWRNERLIEWRNSAAPGPSKQTIDEGPPPQQNNIIEGQQEKTSSPPNSPPSSISTSSDVDSPGSNDMSRSKAMETEFAYIVEVDNSKASDASVEISEKSNDTLENNSQNDVYTNGNDPDSLENAPKRLVSSCPDLSQKDKIDGDPESTPNLIISKNFDFLNVESNLMAIDDQPTTNLDNSSEDLNASTSVGEFEYSQQLRKSSKRLSERLRLQGKPRIEGQAVEIGVDTGNQEESTTVGDVVDGKNGEIEGDDGLSVNTPNGVTDVAPRVSEKEVVVNGTGDETVSKEPENHVSVPNMVQEFNEATERIKELQNENSLLAEDNRELKKKCRTFEGKSRLKERELEEMESEKNELADQVHEMAAELHSLRATNTELRTEVDEANTKLGDVDGWVTREVFEDIRGQLSLSAEECETKDEEIREIQKKCKVLEVENKKVHELEAEVQKLNEKIKEGNDELEGVRRDMKGKEKQILQLERETKEIENSLQEKENEKQEKEKRITEVETEMEELKKNHEMKKKDLQKRMSDREYEILIMKEEKKELCVKMKSFESNVETLREEMKKKEEEHEAAIVEMEKQSAIKDESLSVMVSNLEELVTERDMRIKELKKQIALSGAPESELQAKEHAYEQNKVYLKHLIALVKEKDPSILEVLNKSLSSRDSEDWC